VDPNTEWANLINSLGILYIGKYSDTSPTHCSHDKLTVMSDPSRFNDAEIQQLERLGFIADYSEGVFYSWRFGSA
jgi:hypothetical protein